MPRARRGLRGVRHAELADRGARAERPGPASGHPRRDPTGTWAILDMVAGGRYWSGDLSAAVRHMTRSDTIAALARESWQSTKLLSQLAFQRPMSRASTWFSTAVVSQLFALAAATICVVGIVATPHKLYYLIGLVVSSVVFVGFALAAILVVRSGLHEESPKH